LDQAVRLLVMTGKRESITVFEQCSILIAGQVPREWVQTAYACNRVALTWFGGNLENRTSRRDQGEGMKAKLQEYALIAEIVSAIAVVLSLLYVGYQIRENTQQAQLDSIRAMDQGYLSSARGYVDNEALGVAWHKVLNGGTLTERELDMFGDNLYAHLMLLEETWNAAKSGYLDEAFLEPKIRLMQFKILSSPQVRERHEFMVSQGIYTQEFINWLNEQLKQSPLY